LKEMRKLVKFIINTDSSNGGSSFEVNNLANYNHKCKWSS